MGEVSKGNDRGRRLAATNSPLVVAVAVRLARLRLEALLS